MTPTNSLTKYPQGSVRELWKISSPLILSALSGALMMFLDRLIVARYSTDALNAVTTAGMICAVFQYGAVAIASIAEVFIGQYNGANQQPKMGEPAWQMIWFSLLTYLIFFPLASFGGPFLIPDELQSLGLPYYQWILFFGPALAIVAALSAFFIGHGKTTLVFATVLIGNILNVVLDIILVFGIDGLIPSMGTEGAAIATVISQLTQIAILGVAFLSRHNRKTYGTGIFNFRLKPFLQCLKIGTPNAVGHMIEISAWSILLIMMASVSKEHITVFTIGASFFHIISFFNDGFQKGIIAVSANFIGSKQPKLVKKMIRSGYKILLAAGLVALIPMIIFPEFLIDIFLTNQDTTFENPTQLIEHLKFAFIFIWLFFVLDGLTWVYAGVLTAGGDTLFTMIMNALSVWIFAITPIYFLIYKMHLSPNYVWLLTAVYGLVNAIAFYLRYRSHKWLSKSVIHSAQEISQA